MSEVRSPLGRVLGIDVGGRRTGLAVSDVSGTIARPLEVIADPDPLRHIVRIIDRLSGEEPGLGAIVVGRPLRLDGTPTSLTPVVDALLAALRRRTVLPIFLQDERLTSVEAESRLAELDKDWRRRKRRVDAAAAAVILQEFLDTRPA
jgi:putative holliday junction resolvase